MTTTVSQHDEQIPAEEEFRPLAALVSRYREASLDLPRLCREPFFVALEVSAESLNQAANGLGDYLVKDAMKLRRSTASMEETDYGLWLRSELPRHAENGYSCYVDDSAFMANLWVGRYLEFMVEFFVQLESGCETSTSYLNAHQLTLQKHHNMFISMAFRAGALWLPNRVDIMASLGGGAPEAVVLSDMSDFVRIVRPIASCCLEINDELDSLMQAERAALKT